MNYNIIGRLKKEDRLLGTCFLISPNYVLSAFHSIEKLGDYDNLEVEFMYINELRKLCVVYYNKEIDFLVMKLDRSIIGIDYAQIYDWIPADEGDIWETCGYPGQYEYEEIEEEYLKGDINRIIENKVYDIELNIFEQKESTNWEGVSGAPLIVNENIVGIILKDRSSMIKNKLKAVSMNKIIDFLYLNKEEELLLNLSYKSDNPLSNRSNSFKKECLEKFYSYKYKGSHFEISCFLLKPTYKIGDLIDVIDLFLIDYAHTLDEITRPKSNDLAEQRIYERKINRATEKLKKILIENNRMILVLLWLILEGSFDTPRVAFMMSIINPSVKRDVYVDIDDNKIKLFIGYAEICEDIRASILSVIQEIDSEVNTGIDCKELFIWDTLAVNYLDINSRKMIEEIIINRDTNRIPLEITVFTSYDSSIYTNQMYNLIDKNSKGVEIISNIEVKKIEEEILMLGNEYKNIDVTSINWIMTPVGSVESFKEELQSLI